MVLDLTAVAGGRALGGSYAELLRNIVHDFLDYIPELEAGGLVGGKIVFTRLDEP